MTITLHHLRASRSARIFWVLEELGLQYDVAVHDFGSPEWAKLSPFAKVSGCLPPGPGSCMRNAAHAAEGWP